MDEPRRRAPDTNDPGNISSVSAWRAAKSDPHYLEEAARQAASAASADVEDRVMEWCDEVAAEAWDDL
jgi:hypothetical protein